tara:strand:+ start:686 stop:1015 length:330 start_codon:yes stop_codon:yes gene_type:complete
MLKKSAISKLKKLRVMENNLKELLVTLKEEKITRTMIVQKVSNQMRKMVDVCQCKISDVKIVGMMITTGEKEIKSAKDGEVLMANGNRNAGKLTKMATLKVKMKFSVQK